MSKKRRVLRVGVKPEVVKWAVMRSGWTVDELSNKLNVNENIIHEWMSGEISPTLRQLEDLAKYLKRPMAVFFLSEPPKEKPIPKDYRMIPGKVGKFDKKTHLILRRAKRLQKVSRELLENLNESAVPNVDFVTPSANPRDVGALHRKKFGITEELQRKWKDSYAAFNKLRDFIEDTNIFVFQMQMPVEDARGFVLVDDVPAVIVVNTSDQIEARIFTLLHEYGHVLLNKSGISIPEIALVNPNADKVERWCNEFASEFLLPCEMIEKEFLHYRDSLLEKTTLTKLSNRYKVSKSMLIYKMAKLDFIKKEQYISFLEGFKLKETEDQKGGFGLTQDKRCLQEKGQKFISLVADNKDRGVITYCDAIDYLSVRLRNVDKVMSKAIG